MDTSPRRVLGVRLRSILWVALPVIGLLVVLGGLSAYRLATIARDLRSARDQLDKASADIEAGQLGDARTRLVNAQRLLITTNDGLYGSTEIELIGWLPVARDNLESLRNSVGIALQMVTGGNQLLDITRPLENETGKLEVSLHAGTVPLAAIQAATDHAHELASSLPGRTQEPSSQNLIGGIKDLQHTIYAEAGRRRTELDNVSRALELLTDMAGGNGNRRYLIAVANTAEMRGAGGMILSYGVLESSSGTFSLGDFGGIDDLFLDEGVDPATLGLPADFLARWNGFEATRLWRNATVSPDFTVDGPILGAMFTKKTGLSVDGVIQIDPQGLAAILEGTGPIQVDTVGTVSAENVVDLVLNRAYIDFPSRDQRQEVLGDVAKIAFKTLVNGRFDSLRPFGTALFRAAVGRHLVFYAKSSTVEAEAHFFGADGALPPADLQDSAVLTVQNQSINKLDYYVDTSLSLTGDRSSRKVGELTATITVANSAPAESTSSYVFGPNGPSQEAGLYRGLVSLYLPAGVALVGSEGDRTTSQPALTAESGRSVVTYGVDVRPGETRAVTLHLSISPRPPGNYSFTVVPVARARPTVISVDITTDEGRVRFPSSPLTAPAVLRPRR